MAIVVRVAHAHHQKERAARVAGAGDPPLAAADAQSLAVFFDAGGDIGGVAGGNLGLGHGEGGTDLAAQQWLEPGLLLGRIAVMDQHFHVAGVRRIAVADFGRQPGMPHQFGQRGVVEGGQAGAEARVGQEQIPQAECARLGLQGLDHRRDRPALLGLGQMRLVFGFGRLYHLCDELAKQAMQRTGAVGKRQQVGQTHGRQAYG